MLGLRRTLRRFAVGSVVFAFATAAGADGYDAPEARRRNWESTTCAASGRRIRNSQ